MSYFVAAAVTLNFLITSFMTNSEITFLYLSPWQGEKSRIKELTACTSLPALVSHTVVTTHSCTFIMSYSGMVLPEYSLGYTPSAFTYYENSGYAILPHSAQSWILSKAENLASSSLQDGATTWHYSQPRTTHPPTRHPQDTFF